MKRASLILSGALFLASAAYCGALAPGEGAPEEDGMWDEGPAAGRDRGPGPGAGGHVRFAEGKKSPWRSQRSGFGGGRKMRSEQEALDIIKKHDPDFAAKLSELKKRAPRKYNVLMRNSGRTAVIARMENDEGMEKDAVRAFSLDYETKELSRKYNKAADGNRARIRKELSVKVSELFDIRLKVRESKIKRMEKDLGKLKKRLEKRKGNKARIVEERVRQLTGESFGW